MKVAELFEMAAPRPEDKTKIYYHGTEDFSVLDSIKSKGLIAPEIFNPRKSLAPQQGKEYITPFLKYAVMYTLGGDIAGHNVPERWLKEKPFGLMCVISGNELKDIVPDEDSIGKMIWEKKPDWLFNFASKHLGDATFRKVMDGDYAAWARAGKTLVKKMTDNQKLNLIDNGAHIAHEGGLHVSEIWKFDKHLCPKLVDEGTNFFDLAERLI